MKDIADDLSKINTFANMSQEDRLAIADICRKLEVAEESIIAHQNTMADEIFALMKGEVGIWMDYGQANADLLTVTEAPSLVGEMGVLDNLPRSATLVAHTPIYGYSIDGPAFRTLLSQRVSIPLSLLQSLSLIVRNSNDSFVEELRNRNQELLRSNEELRTTQRKLVHRERLSVLGKFTSMIMHDLRNPLSVIKAYSDMLELKLGDEEIEQLRTYITQIRRETGRITSLTNEWLDYSRGEITLSYEHVKTAALLEELKSSVDSTIKAKNIKLTFDNEFDGFILIDHERILRILINLVNNAIKAVNMDGNINISVVEISGRLRIAVEDNGIGMDNETRMNAFEPFYTRSESGGTGLGMHIVKTIVEAHNGTVEIKSTLGEGTEIDIYLPLTLQ